jgi:hypothetical protein
MFAGDHLQPYTAIPLVEGIERTDASGDLDFAAARTVLSGESERVSGGAGDFMIADAGTNQGAAPGARFAVYRAVGEGAPLAAVGEAVVVSAGADTSVVRLTQTRDAVLAGDLLVPRRR